MCPKCHCNIDIEEAIYNAIKRLKEDEQREKDRLEKLEHQNKMAQMKANMDFQRAIFNNPPMVYITY